MVHELWQDLLKYLTGTLKYSNMVIRQYVLYGVNDAVLGYCHIFFFFCKEKCSVTAIQWRYMVFAIFCYYFNFYVCFMYSFRLF